MGTGTLCPNSSSVYQSVFDEEERGKNDIFGVKVKKKYDRGGSKKSKRVSEEDC